MTFTITPLVTQLLPKTQRRAHRDEHIIFRSIAQRGPKGLWDKLAGIVRRLSGARGWRRRSLASYACNGVPKPTFIVLRIPKSPRSTAAAEELARPIASLRAGAHLQLGAIWLVRSEESADELRDRLSADLPNEDALVVVEMGEQAAWTGLAAEDGEWLVSNVWASRWSGLKVITA
jgi:hypothetical protein